MARSPLSCESRRASWECSVHHVPLHAKLLWVVPHSRVVVNTVRAHCHHTALGHRVLAQTSVGGSHSRVHGPDVSAVGRVSGCTCAFRTTVCRCESHPMGGSRRMDSLMNASSKGMLPGDMSSYDGTLALGTPSAASGHAPCTCVTVLGKVRHAVSTRSSKAARHTSVRSCS